MVRILRCLFWLTLHVFHVWVPVPPLLILLLLIFSCMLSLSVSLSCSFVFAGTCIHNQTGCLQPLASSTKQTHACIVIQRPRIFKEHNTANQETTNRVLHCRHTCISNSSKNGKPDRRVTCIRMHRFVRQFVGERGWVACMRISSLQSGCCALCLQYKGE